MKIEIWTDFICPFCYLGKQRLETAIDQFPHKDKIFIQYRSYEIAARHHENDYQRILEYIEDQIDQHHLSNTSSNDLLTHLQTQIADGNVTFDMNTLPFLNTFDAHRLMKYAYQQQKGNKFVNILFNAFFFKGLNISDHDILIDLASKAGLDPLQAELILQTCKFTKKVRCDEEQAEELGISTVPFFVFNEMYAMSGIQPIEVFIDVLHKVWQEECDHNLQEFSVKQSNLTYYCDSDGCRKIE